MLDMVYCLCDKGYVGLVSCNALKVLDFSVGVLEGLSDCWEGTIQPKQHQILNPDF